MSNSVLILGLCVKFSHTWERSWRYIDGVPRILKRLGIDGQEEIGSFSSSILEEPLPSHHLPLDNILYVEVLLFLMSIGGRRGFAHHHYLEERHLWFFRNEQDTETGKYKLNTKIKRPFSGFLGWRVTSRTMSKPFVFNFILFLRSHGSLHRFCCLNSLRFLVPVLIESQIEFTVSHSLLSTHFFLYPPPKFYCPIS